MSLKEDLLSIERELWTGGAEAVREDDERYPALITSGYTVRGGGWKLIFHQQTPLPERGT